MLADFQRVYGLHLRNTLAGLTGYTILETAQLAAELPRGSQIWRYFGGSQAVSDETELLMAIELDLSIANWHTEGDKSQHTPKVIPFPLGEEDRDQQSDKVESKAERWKRRHS